jgi:hypothetical protein
MGAGLAPNPHDAGPLGAFVHDGCKNALGISTLS